MIRQEVILVKLRIRQRVFAFADAYDVYDEFGVAQYFVKAELIALGHQIHVYDKKTGREVGTIHQRLLTLLPTFEIEINGRTVGTVRRELSFLRPRYDVDFLGWKAEGNIMGWDYRVTRSGRTVLTISKQVVSRSDTYTLEYDCVENEIPGLLLVIAIDAANCTGKD